MNSRAIFIVVFSIAFLLSANVAFAGLVISSASDVNGEPEGVAVTGGTVGSYSVPTFGEDVVSFTDRTHQWNGATAAGLPSYLVGGDYVMTANDARDNGSYTLNVTLAQSAYLYLFRDNRRMGASLPDWYNDGVGIDMINTWTPIGADENGNGTGAGSSIEQTMTLFQAVNASTGEPLIAAGTHQFYESDTSSMNMYGVVATTTARALPDAPDPKEAFDITVDIGPQNQRVETGHIGAPDPSYAGTPGNNSNGAETDYVPIDTGTGTFFMSISDTDTSGGDQGRIDWRDRGDSSSTEALVQLGEDFIKNSGGVIQLKLDELPEGEYEVTSFHVDSDFSQSDEIDVFVDVGDGNGFVDALAAGEEGTAGADLGGVNNLTNDAMLNSSAEFSFVADGVNPVLIVFDGTASGDNETPLNGFHMVFTPPAVPEPSTFILGAFALLGMCALRRRRK